MRTTAPTTARNPVKGSFFPPPAPVSSLSVMVILLLAISLLCASVQLPKFTPDSEGTDPNDAKQSYDEVKADYQSGLQMTVHLRDLRMEGILAAGLAESQGVC